MNILEDIHQVDISTFSVEGADFIGAYPEIVVLKTFACVVVIVVAVFIGVDFFTVVGTKTDALNQYIVTCKEGGSSLTSASSVADTSLSYWWLPRGGASRLETQ